MQTKRMVLINLFPIQPLLPEDIRKSYFFVMFLGGKESVRWEQMG